MTECTHPELYRGITNRSPIHLRKEVRKEEELTMVTRAAYERGTSSRLVRILGRRSHLPL